MSKQTVSVESAQLGFDLAKEKPERPAQRRIGVDVSFESSERGVIVQEVGAE